MFIYSQRYSHQTQSVSVGTGDLFPADVLPAAQKLALMSGAELELYLLH